ncbi:MAG: Uma2 family endonuclease [Saprospiraceae bacterium]
MTDVLVKKYTYAEFRSLEFPDNDLSNYELLDGEIVQKSSPSLQHQRISGNIYFQIRLYLTQNPIGEVFSAPLDVVLEDRTAPQPDVFFVSKERDFILDEREGVVIGTPDLIVEIISPSSVQRDRYQKKELYERFAVREFWLVDPQNRSIEIFKLAQNQFQLHAFADETGASIASTVLPGLEISVPKLM